MGSDHCIACGFHLSFPAYRAENQPLAALNLPGSQEDATRIQRFTLDFRTCASCGHIFNTEFEYTKIPYQQNSNLMYNKGSGWQEHLHALIARIREHYDLEGKTVLDIGCGDGWFLKLLKDTVPSIRAIGYEPGIEAENAEKNGLTVYQDYFIPERDLPKVRPDLLLCRHVIEHLASPHDFVADIAYWANHYGLFTPFVAEVPCIENAVRDARINDYLYEHVSNFTLFSFENMFQSAGYEVEHSFRTYHDEVAVAFVRPQPSPRLHEIRNLAQHYHERIRPLYHNVRQKLDALLEEGKTLAFWGGTGKGSSFLNGFGLDHTWFPVVVDSDPLKTGKFVPGMGQEIRSPEYLNTHPVDVIVVTTQWRVHDIMREIQDRAIPHQQVLYLVEERLVAYDESKPSPR